MINSTIRSAQAHARLILLFGLLLTAPSVFAKPAWLEGTPSIHNGTTYEFYHRGHKKRWKTPGGDWLDRAETPQGDVAFAVESISRRSRGTGVDIDITDIYRAWMSGEIPNEGLFIRSLNGGDTLFHSKEAPNNQGPRLTTVSGNVTKQIDASLDTYTDPSTYKALGHRPSIKIGKKNHAMVYFEVDRGATAELDKAVLTLNVAKVYADTTIGIFLPGTSSSRKSEVGAGHATAMEKPAGKDGDTYYAQDFEQPAPLADLSGRGEYQIIQTDAANGKAMKVTIKSRQHHGLNLSYNFNDREPIELFFRYYLKFDDNWNPSDGGKLPGISGTYNKAGWGGRPADGYNGWSLRGMYLPPVTHEGKSTVPIGYYAYHPDLSRKYGVHWLWDVDNGAGLEKEKWYCIEQYIRLNDPDKKNAVVRGWVDDQDVFSRDDLSFRRTDALKIEKVWLNVYHGGGGTPPQDISLYIDDIVISTQRIGCQSNKSRLSRANNTAPSRS